MDVGKNCEDAMNWLKLRKYHLTILCIIFCQLLSGSHYPMFNSESLCASVLPAPSRVFTLPHFFLLEYCLCSTPFEQTFPVQHSAEDLHPNTDMALSRLYIFWRHLSVCLFSSSHLAVRDFLTYIPIALFPIALGLNIGL